MSKELNIAVVEVSDNATKTEVIQLDDLSLALIGGGDIVIAY